MSLFIPKPTRIEAQGNKPKLIEEFFGVVNSKSQTISIAKMDSPAGWIEPGQKPEFAEYTVVLEGTLKVETESSTYHVHAGEAIQIEAGEWVRYSTPESSGARYMAICLPAFSPETVHRDAIS
jgi:quercetin dioxygenase-like cupin family protein